MLHLDRAELESLTGLQQPKRMCAWLLDREWVFEPPKRRGDIPKVARAYHDARQANGGKPLPQQPAAKDLYISRSRNWHSPARMAQLAADRMERAAFERRLAEITRSRIEWKRCNAKRFAAEAAAAKRALVRHHAARRRVSRISRTPPWADMRAIRAIYAEADRLTRATGILHTVDHEIPLQGRLVSGLHVETNLQVLTGTDNSRKGNRFEVA